MRRSPLTSTLGPDLSAAQAWSTRREAITAAGPTERGHLLAAEARAARQEIVQTIGHAGLGHIGGDLSVIDILTTLYNGILRIDPRQPEWPGRDRLILSKGHCACALYVTLARTGYISHGDLGAFAADLSPLNGHPSHGKVPGVEFSTGPLGHGLPEAVGVALGARLRDERARVFVALGDGELQEGSNWEAAMAASQYGLTNLVATVDRNRLQQGARTEDTNHLEPLAEKWAAFGWNVIEVDGHDHAQLLAAYQADPAGRPTAVIARTVKGKGVSFMEDRVEWHHKVPTDEQVSQAIAELSQ
jgi:transketolase